MAIIEWLDGVGTEEPFSVHRSSRVTATRREILEWARRQRLDERAVDPAADSAETVSGLRRDLALAADGSYQVRLRLSTFEMHSGLLIVASASSELHTAESLASLRTIAEHIALVLQDRSIRAQVEELSERNRERAETLNQILEISNDLKRNRTLDDLFQSIVSAVAKSLGFQAVLLSL